METFYFLPITFCILLYKVVSLQIAVCRLAAEKQPCESELQGGGVAIDQLSGNVQVGVQTRLIHIVQRTVRHQEEVPRGEIERVH